MTVTTVATQAYVWDEHEEPKEVPEEALMGLLETKEYGKLVRTYPVFWSGKEELGELVLHYRAFSDEFRGRQVVSDTDLATLDKAFHKRKLECTLRVFSPTELYALKPVHVDYDPGRLADIHLQQEVYFGDSHAAESTKRVEIRTLADHCSDGRRTWTLQTVWFDGKPVMVVNSSGRDGDEYHDRWITDGDAFHSLVNFLKSFCPENDFVKASAKIPAMTEFYNGTIHDYYDVKTQEPKDLRK